MRREFKEILRKEMEKNPNIWIITPDLGYKFLDEIAHILPNQFIKCRATEQLAMGIAVGLTYSNPKIIPIVYSITPFLLCQPYSWIRNFINNEKCPVKLLGAGRDKDYLHDGFSHWANDDTQILENFKNITCFWPCDLEELKENIGPWLNINGPTYLNLKR